jgi:hypothetical protein
MAVGAKQGSVGSSLSDTKNGMYIQMGGEASCVTSQY